MKSIGNLFIVLFACASLVVCQETETHTEVIDQTNTTTADITTPAPTSAPFAVGNWTLPYNNGSLCIMLQMGAQLDISYNTITNKTEEAKLKLDPKTVKVSDKESSCEDGVMVLIFNDNKLILNFVEKDNKVSLESVTLHIIYDNQTFPNATEKDHEYVATNQSLFEVPLGKSYLCNSSSEITLSNGSKIEVRNLQLEALSVVTAGKFSTAEECAADDGDVSDIVPIAVGCALAGLVVIVLIAYLVGRRHKRQKGYESV